MPSGAVAQLRLSHIGLEEGDTAYVELLNKSDKAVAKVQVVDDRADFFYLKPAEYYLRLFVDRNGNGIWDTGCYDELRQPEAVYYFPKPLTVKAKWDMEQAWNVQGIRRVEQKPKAITKQKPDKKKNPKDRNRERDEAVNWCRERGVEFYAINKDYPEERQEWNNHFSRKLKVDMWIDDRNIGGLPDWGLIYQMIHYNKTWHDIMREERRSLRGENETQKKKHWWQF